MDGLRIKCCIVGCANDDKQCPSDTKFYRFPSDDEAVSGIQRSMWVEAIQNSSLNGPTWLPSEFSMICSEHFLEIKSVDDPSFLPSLFPTESEAVMNSESQFAWKPIGENENPHEYSVLQKIVDRLPLQSVVNRGKAGHMQRETDTSRLQDAFRELACHVCRMLVAHESELLIEGTVGITVDGGARVMLLHFTDQIRKTDATNEEETVHQDTAKGNILHNVAKNDDKGINRVQSTSEEKAPDVGNMDYSRTSPPFAANCMHYSSGSSKILSDLAQQTTGADSDTISFSTQKRKANLDSSSIYDKPKQQTLLRELLCAPLPPKRPCRPINPSPTATKAGVVGEVRPELVPHRRPTANSSVLGGLLRTGNYQRESSFSPRGALYGRDGHSKHEPGTLSQGSYGGQPLGIDAASPQFGGNAVQALLRLASEHAATGRHDLVRNSIQHREITPSRNDTFVGDGLADMSLDRRYNVLYQNLVGSDFGSTSSEFAGMSQNSTRSDSSTSEPAPVKQEVLDPGYE